MIKTHDKSSSAKTYDTLIHVHHRDNYRAWSSMISALFPESSIGQFISST